MCSLGLRGKFRLLPGRTEQGSETIVFDVLVSRALFAALLFGKGRP
jgi:hypothetical protein